MSEHGGSRLPAIAAIDPGAPQARGGRGEFPARVRELAFEVWWLEAGRNASLTARRLRDHLPEGFPEDLLPGDRVVRYWAAKDDWAGRATERMRHAAPLLEEDRLARFEVVVGKGLELWDRILSLDPEVVGAHRGPVLNPLTHAAIRAAELGGVGLRNARMVRPAYAAPKPEVDVAAMGEAKLTRSTRSLITGEDPD